MNRVVKVSNKELSTEVKNVLVGELLPAIKLSKERQERINEAIEFWMKCNIFPKPPQEGIEPPHKA